MSIELEESCRWPNKGDRLFRAEENWESEVYFEERKVVRHAYIWGGYMNAGAKLVEQCEGGKSPLERQELVYPILFCYRHALEVAMKWIIGQYGRHAEIVPNDYLDHDLWKLWQACKKVILEIGSDGETEALLAVQQVVKDFHDLDKSSFAFRYSMDKNGMVIGLPNKPFDLSNIKDVMEGVDNLFIGADSELDSNIDAAGL